MTSTAVLKVFPSNNEFIGEFTIPDAQNDADKGKLYQTIIILDRSGSMGSTVERVITKILPLFFSKLSYRKLNQIFFITFESNSELHAKVVADFPLMQIRSGGNTLMESAVHKCRDIFEDLDSDKPVRILTISDGMIDDQKRTCSAADDLKTFLENKSFFINSKAVRLFTSSSQPDTTALCSLLQINNATPRSLVDIVVTESDDFIATKMAELFKEDCFEKTKVLRTTEKVLRRKPWDDTTSKLLFAPGVNNVWISQLPSDGFRLNGLPLRVVMQNPITLEHHKALMDCNSELIVETMKVLKVVNSIESNKTLYNMNRYFSSNIGGSVLTSQVNTIFSDTRVVGMTSSEKALYIARK